MYGLIFFSSGPLLQAQKQGSFASSMLPIILIFAVFYLFMIRPQQRRQKEQKMRSENLQKGDKVVTIGGVHGVVSDLHEKTVIIKTGRDSHIEFSRSAVSTAISPRAATEQPAAPQRRFFFGRSKETKVATDAAKGPSEASKIATDSTKVVSVEEGKSPTESGQEKA